VLSRRLKPGVLGGPAPATPKAEEPASVHCTECGASNGSSFKFCQACGKPLGAAT
jgi:hypothetical protein